MRKSILLFLALLLPVLIFVFLRFFGKNEFKVPILFESPSSEMPSDCAIEYEFPYVVNSHNVAIEGITVVFFTSGLSEAVLEEAGYQLNRLNNEFKEQTPEIKWIGESTDKVNANPDQLVLDSQSYTREKKCIFLAGDSRLVLLDSNKHIRGLYKDTSLKEIDRLMLEIKIIYKQF